MNRHADGLDHGNVVFLLSVVGNVVVSLLGLLNGGIQNIIDAVLLEISSNINGGLIGVSRWELRQLMQRQTYSTKGYAQRRNTEEQRRREKEGRRISCVYRDNGNMMYACAVVSTP